jgi:hypothetical protein
MKTQYNEIKEQNNLLLKQISKKENENEKIKDLTQQVQIFREELVLSQALVNSLKAELENITKNKNYLNKNESILDNEKIRMTLKKNNMLLSNILQENNELILRKKATNYPTNNNDILNNDLLINLQNNLKVYENKFDYFNDYINNIKNKIDMIFNYIKNILCKFESPENNKRFSENLKMKIDNLKKDIQKIKGIDRFNLDSQDDEQTLQIFMNIVKLLLNELEQNKPNINTNNINPQNKTFDKTKKYLFDILNILKETVDENGKKQLISDALNILSNLNELYRLKNNNNISNGYNNINEKIMEQEKELDYIKKLLLNHRKENRNKKLTYSMNYSTKIGIQKNKSGYYFQYE